MKRKRMRKRQKTEVTDDGDIRFIVSKIESCKEKIAEIEVKKSELEDQIRAYKGMISTFEKQIHSLRNPDTLRVSEHALVRYFERVEGFDLNKIRDKILSPYIVNMVNTLGNTGTYPLDEYRLVIKDKVVTTILPPKSKENGNKD